MNGSFTQIGLAFGILVGMAVSPPDGRAQIPQKVISTHAASAMSVHAADLNGDGHADVISASLADDKVAWYENRIDAGSSDSDGFGSQRVVTRDAEFAKSVATADLDGDGDLDILSASSYDDKIAWYENRLGESSADADGFGPAQVITTQADGAQSVRAADLDGDGAPDVLSASANDDTVAWYENQIGDAGSDADGFGAARTISGNAASAYGVAVGDLDGDGDPDVLSASSFDDKVAWYENQLDESGADGDGFGSQRVITTNAEGAVSVVAADLDDDGDPDAVSASSYDDKVAWYENRVGESEADADGFGPQNSITTGAEYVSSVYATRLDGDSDIDILSASRADDTVSWYENQLDGAGGDFSSEKLITTRADEAQSVSGRDLDGNGTVDVLSASSNDSKIAWYSNTDGVLPVELVGFRASRVSDESVTLVWQTASETGNATFEVQRGRPSDADAREKWSTVGTVRGHGTTGRSRTYRFIDDSPPFAADSLSYRLRQVDTDGTTRLFGPVVVGRRGRGIALVGVYPNPARSQATVQLTKPTSQAAQIRIHDLLGREVQRTSISDGSERVGLDVDVRNFPPGVYFVQLVVGDVTRSDRLIVVR